MRYGIPVVLSCVWILSGCGDSGDLVIRDDEGLGRIKYRGVSSFAAMDPDFPCEQFLRVSEYSQAPAMAVLWNTFGYDESCVLAFTTRFADRPHALEIHPKNGPCERNGRCEGNDAKEVTGFRANAIQAFIQRVSGPHTKVYVSLGLEDDYDDSEMYRVLSLFPRGFASLVRSTHSGSSLYPDVWEIHPGRAVVPIRGERCIANEDGAFHTLKQTRQFFADYDECEVVFAWRPAHQGTEAGFTPPSERTFVIPESDVLSLGMILAETSSDGR